MFLSCLAKHIMYYLTGQVLLALLASCGSVYRLLRHISVGIGQCCARGCVLGEAAARS